MPETSFDQLSMKVHRYLAEKEEILKELRSLNQEHIDSGLSTPSPGLAKRIAHRMDRLKVIMDRMNKLGRRYNIVRVWGKYIINTGNLAVGKDFQMYYTDISTMDARMLTEMQFKDGLLELHAEDIEVGVVIEFKWKK